MPPSEKQGAAATLPSASRAPSESLLRVERGEMSLDDYLDERAEAALEQLKGRISVERLDLVRGSLREHIRTDPVVVEMIRRLTGQTPAPEPPPLKN